MEKIIYVYRKHAQFVYGLVSIYVAASLLTSIYSYIWIGEMCAKIWGFRADNDFGNTLLCQFRWFCNSAIQ